MGISFKCEHCNESFRRALDLKTHTLIHQTSKRFFCTSCTKSYSTKQSLNTHLAKEHKSSDKQINDQVDLSNPIKSLYNVYNITYKFWK